MQEIGCSANIFVAKLAAQAVAALAIIAMKLEKCLRVGCVLAWDASSSPVTDDAVVLGRQLLPQGESAVAQALVGLVAAISEEHGRHAVDDEQLYGGLGE